MFTRVNVGENEAMVAGQSTNLVVQALLFQAWLKDFDHDKLELRQVYIQSAHILDNGKVIFATMEADVLDRRTGCQLPGIVFLRGPAICLLVFIRCKETNQYYVVMTEQARVPLGRADFRELPAGMLDKNDGVVGRAIGELKEETGIVITKDMLVPLGKWAPSAGGCDERLESFWGRVDLSQEEIQAILDKLHGEESEGEQIRVRMYTIKEFIQYLQSPTLHDGKVLATLALFMLSINPGAVEDVLNARSPLSRS